LRDFVNAPSGRQPFYNIISERFRSFEVASVKSYRDLSSRKSQITGAKAEIASSVCPDIHRTVIYRHVFVI